MHRIFLFGSAAAVALSLAAAPANAAHFNGWYISLEVGANWIDDDDAIVVDDITTASFPEFVGTTDHDTGWAGLGSLGYAWNNWRVELELGFRSNESSVLFVDTAAPFDPNFVDSFDLDEFSQMVNLIYDFRLGERWSLSLGAGVGGDLVDVEHNSAPGNDFVIDDDDYVFAWQLIAGVNYAITPRSELFLNYRFFNADAPEIEAVGFVDGPYDIHMDDIQKHTVTVGWRFDLYPDEVRVAAPPPAPPPPAPEPPPPPPAPKDFIVFFAHNKANLTAEASEVVSQAAAEVKGSGAQTVIVTGHADRSGSARYNDALSLRRANNVTRALVSQGVARGSITVQARGESEPTVATADGVREPQNRRVVINLGEGGPSSGPPPADDEPPPPDANGDDGQKAPPPPPPAN